LEQDGKVDFADFLHMARYHLDLNEILGYIAMRPATDSATTPAKDSAHRTPHAPFGQVTRVRSEADIDSLVAQGDAVIVQLPSRGACHVRNLQRPTIAWHPRTTPCDS